ncbi:hypothetical protein BDQ17DRAFT_1354951 [Cyathus striatus]|nr:hypothetical protein BDQ17DRAFT_1354951 [Cyathus striatus]
MHCTYITCEHHNQQVPTFPDLIGFDLSSLSKWDELLRLGHVQSFSDHLASVITRFKIIIEATIRRLPDDVLINIFLLITEPFIDVHRNLAIVCKKWRNIVLNTPKFWSAMNISKPINDWTETSHQNRKWAIINLGCLCSTWKHVDIHAAWIKVFASYFPEIRHCVASLQSLTIRRFGSHYMVKDPFIASAPLLSTLMLDDLRHCPFETMTHLIPWSQITCLFWKNGNEFTVPQFQDMLCTLKNLELLEINHYSPKLTSNWQECVRSVLLNLRVLSIFVEQPGSILLLLHIIEAPMLLELNIDCARKQFIEPGMGSGIFFAGYYSSALIDTSGSITKMYMAGLNWKLVHRLLEQNPNLDSLELHNILDLELNLLSSLRWEGHGQKCLVPNLRTLVYIYNEQENQSRYLEMPTLPKIQGVLINISESRSSQDCSCTSGAETSCIENCLQTPLDSVRIEKNTYISPKAGEDFFK